MERNRDDYKEAAPHEDKLRRYQIGRWLTDCRLARGWTMVDVAIHLHTEFPHSHLGNQGRISELETGNGVNRARWTPEILRFLHRVFQPCPPLPDDPWEITPEYAAYLREQEALAEKKRRLEEARRIAAEMRRGPATQLGLELDLAEPELVGSGGSTRGRRR
jgi:hypothetical protein